MEDEDWETAVARTTAHNFSSLLQIWRMPQSIDELQVTNMKTKIDQLILRFMLLTLFIIPVDSLGAGDEFKWRPDHGVVDGKSDHKGSILGDMIIVGANQDNDYRNDGKSGTRNGSDNPET